MTVRIVGLNCQGASSPTYLPALMREAKRWRVDVLLLQELNVDPKQVDKYKRAAERVGFWLAVSCKGTGAHRGGTAVAVRCEHSVLAQREPRAVVAEGIGDTRNGKVCAVEVWVESEWRRLISVYAPADESERRLFVEGLEGDNALLKGAIVQGDMNCVARPSVDEHRINGRVEAAGTGKKLESVLTQAGLIDAHRLVNGEEARNYTRISSTIKRRLDRFYTPAYNAFWRWTSVKTEPNFFRDSSQRSDHLAVMAEGCQKPPSQTLSGGGWRTSISR